MAHGGQNKHQPTDESRRYVRAMAGYGLREVDIARILEISRPTLEKHYEDELQDGRAQATLKIAQTVYNKAAEGNMTAAIFWLKTRAKWSEKVEVTGEDGGPVQFQQVRRVIVDPQREDESGEEGDD